MAIPAYNQQALSFKWLFQRELFFEEGNDSSMINLQYNFSQRPDMARIGIK